MYKCTTWTLAIVLLLSINLTHLKGFGLIYVQNVSEGNNETSSSLKVNIDKSAYFPQENVTVIVSNTGNDSLLFPNSNLGIKILDSDTKERIPIPLISLPKVTELNANESQKIVIPLQELVNGSSQHLQPGRYVIQVDSIPMNNGTSSTSNATIAVRDP